MQNQGSVLSHQLPIAQIKEGTRSYSHFRESSHQNADAFGLNGTQTWNRVDLRMVLCFVIWWVTRLRGGIGSARARVVRIYWGWAKLAVQTSRVKILRVVWWYRANQWKNRVSFADQGLVWILFVTKPLECLQSLLSQVFRPDQAPV